jgi:hypothetical protein
MCPPVWGTGLGSMRKLSSGTTGHIDYLKLGYR